MVWACVAGMERGDHVALHAANRREWVADCLAVISARAVVVPLDAQLGDEALGHVLEDSGARHVFGLVPDMGGPRTYGTSDLLREYLRATHRHRLIVPFPLPGKAAHAFRAGLTWLSNRPPNLGGVPRGPAELAGTVPPPHQGAHDIKEQRPGFLPLGSHRDKIVGR